MKSANNIHWRSEATGALRFPNIAKINNFNYSWINYDELIEFPMINTSNGQTFFASWAGCHKIQTFPKLNMSKGRTFSETWESCTSLITFPQIDFSNGLCFRATWRNCIKLKEFPLINAPKAKTFENCWRKCFSLEHFPPNMFDNLLISKIEKNCFDNTWTGCNLTTQSIDNILTSINKIKVLWIHDLHRPREITLGTKHNTTDLLTPELNKTIKSLKSKNWTILINEWKL